MSLSTSSASQSRAVLQKTDYCVKIFVWLILPLRRYEPFYVRPAIICKSSVGNAYEDGIAMLFAGIVSRVIGDTVIMNRSRGLSMVSEASLKGSRLAMFEAAEELTTKTHNS